MRIGLGLGLLFWILRFVAHDGLCQLQVAKAVGEGRRQAKRRPEAVIYLIDATAKLAISGKAVLAYHID